MMKLNKKFTLFLLLAISLFSLINTVDAYTFTQTGIEGNWTDSTFPHFSTYNNNNTNGRINYTIGNIFNNVTNDGGNYFLVTINQIDSNNTFPSFYSISQFYFVIDCYYTYQVHLPEYPLNPIEKTEHIYVQFYLAKEAGLLIDTTELRLGTNGNIPVRNPDVDAIDYKFIIRKISDNEARVEYSAIKPSGLANILYNETFIIDNSLFWLASSTKLYLGYSSIINEGIFGGSGETSIDVTFLNDILTTNTLPEFQYDVQQGNSNSWITIAWDVLTQIYNIISLIFTWAITLFLIAIQYLPYIGLLYLADMLITALITRNFQPIGLLFMSLWEAFMRVIEIMQGVLDWIVSVIDVFVPDWL